MRLPGFRYEQIKRKVVETFELTGERSIPIDPFAIARKLGIHLVAYSQLSEAGKAACLKKSKSGFKYLLEQPGAPSIWYIYYNDEMPYGHVRFTILHEIGHIVLGHLQESDVAEAEANFFAKFAIAPPSLVDLIKPNDYIEIARAFDLSSESALNSWSYYRKWQSINSTTDYELKLESLFTIIRGGSDEPIKRALRIKKGA